MTKPKGKQLFGDFYDFVSGAFRSRIQAGTLTDDRTLTAPDKTGTIAITSDLRPIATSQPIVYVSPTGSDSNNGLSAGTPFLTIQKAIDYLTTIDCGGFSPRINLAAGTYVQPQYGLKTKNCVGVGEFVEIYGDPNNRTAYKIQCQLTGTGADAAIHHAAATLYRLTGVEIGCSSNLAQYPKYIECYANLTFNNVCFRGAFNTHDFVFCVGGYMDTVFNSTIQLEDSFRYGFTVSGSTFYIRPRSDYTSANFVTSSGATAANAFFAGISSSIEAYALFTSGAFAGKSYDLKSSAFETYGYGTIPGSVAGTISFPTTAT